MRLRMARAEAGRNLRKEVCDKITSNITNQVWRPGDKLPTERELIEMFSVSRITIREAVGQLVGLGLLETIQGSGIYVRQYDPNLFVAPMAQVAYLTPTRKEDILNILNVRLLETIVAGQAAQNSTEEGIAKLKAIQKKLRDHPTSLTVHAQADAEFHLQICQMTNNPFMVQVCKTIYEALRNAMPTISRIMGSDYALRYHEKLIDTIRKHYVTEAKAAMEEHLLVTIRAVEAVPEDSEIFKELSDPNSEVLKEA